MVLILFCKIYTCFITHVIFLLSTLIFLITIVFEIMKLDMTFIIPLSLCFILAWALAWIQISSPSTCACRDSSSTYVWASSSSSVVWYSWTSTLTKRHVSWTHAPMGSSLFYLVYVHETLRLHKAHPLKIVRDPLSLLFPLLWHQILC